MKILFNQLIAWGRPVEELELAGLTLDCHRRVWSSGQLSTYLKIGIDLSGKCPSDRPHCSVTPVTLTDAMLHTWSHQISIVQQILQTLMSLPPIAILFCKCQVDDLPWFSLLADFLLPPFLSPRGPLGTYLFVRAKKVQLYNYLRIMSDPSHYTLQCFWKSLWHCHCHCSQCFQSNLRLATCGKMWIKFKSVVMYGFNP